MPCPWYGTIHPGYGPSSEVSARALSLPGLGLGLGPGLGLFLLVTAAGRAARAPGEVA